MIKTLLVYQDGFEYHKEFYRIYEHVNDLFKKIKKTYKDEIY